MRNTNYLVLQENRMARDESIGAWESANFLAEQTMELALAATAHTAAGDYIKADKVAKDASERLRARLVLVFAELGGP